MRFAKVSRKAYATGHRCTTMPRDIDEIRQDLVDELTDLDCAAGLNSEDRERLATEAAQAMQLHSDHIRDRLQAAVGHMPAVLRPVVRKAFGL